MLGSQGGDRAEVWWGLNEAFVINGAVVQCVHVCMVGSAAMCHRTANKLYGLPVLLCVQACVSL